MKIFDLFETDEPDEIDPFSKEKTDVHSTSLLARAHYSNAGRAIQRLSKLYRNGVIVKIPKYGHTNDQYVELYKYAPGLGIANIPENQKVIAYAKRLEDSLYLSHDYISSLPPNQQTRSADITFQMDKLIEEMYNNSRAVETFYTHSNTYDLQGWKILVDASEWSILPAEDKQHFVKVYDDYDKLRLYTRKENLDKPSRTLKIIQYFAEQQERWQSKYEELQDEVKRRNAGADWHG